MHDEPPIFWDVLEEHLDDAAFLFTQWERCLVSPAYTLAEVAERDEERLLANVDGLVSGGARARERVLVSALEADDPAVRAAGALALVATGDPSDAKPLLALLREGDAPSRAAAQRALELADAAWVDEALRGVLRDGAAPAQASALAALAFRRASAGAATSGLSAGDDPALLAAALRSAAASSDRVSVQLVLDAFGAADAGVRDAAITAGLVRGIPEAWPACQGLVRGASDASFLGEEPASLLFAATLGDVREVEPLVRAHGAPSLRRAAVWALGYSGRAAAVEACLPLLADPALGKLAAEAIVAITGLPARAPFVASREARDAREPVPLAEEIPHASLLPTPEDDLPLLEPDAVGSWWAENRARFDRKARYLDGAPWGAASVIAALERGPMRRRRGLALELAVRTRGAVRLETRAFTARQRVELEAAAPALPRDLDRFTP